MFLEQTVTFLLLNQIRAASLDDLRILLIRQGN